MNDHGGDSVVDYLERVKSTSDAWGNDWDTDAVGRIDDVFFSEADATEVARLRNRMDDLRERASIGRHTRMFGGSFTFTNVVNRLEESLSVLEEDEDAIVVVVELPNGERFGEVFPKPATTSDKFFQLCDAIGVSISSADAIDTDVIVGKTVPVERGGTDWRIDLTEAL